MGDEVVFLPPHNTKVFYKIAVPFWVLVARQAQSIKNNQFTISLQNLKENMKDEVEYLPVEKRWNCFFKLILPF